MYSKTPEEIIPISLGDFFFFFNLELSEIRHLFGIQKIPGETGQYRKSSFLPVKLISATEFGGNLPYAAKRETASTFI